MSHIFISYSRKDADFARYLRGCLQVVGLQVWMDEEGITPSGRWWQTIEANIDACFAFVIVMSSHAIESDWVEREILRAEYGKKPIYPVWLQGAMWSRLANIQCEDMRRGLKAKPSQQFLDALKKHVPLADRPADIILTIKQGNILRTAADVVAFKYAQNHYGADAEAASRLINTTTLTTKALSPARGDYVLINTDGALDASRALFIGTPRLRYISYRYLQDFARDALRILYDNAPETTHLAMTIHGPGFGLDETESLISQFNGYLEAIHDGTYPAELRQITIVEYVPRRARRLQKMLNDYLQKQDYNGITVHEDDEGGWRVVIAPTDDSTAAKSQPQKIESPRPRTNALVILPAGEETDDIFYYGIQGAVHARGLLCERLTTNAGEIEPDLLDSIRARVDEAAIVIADLTAIDPYIMLQVGYAWGRGLPVVLISSDDLPEHFRIGHHVIYSRIRELEMRLGQILETLQSGGVV